ncbi:MAG: DUF2007 domain-containing protein [Chloroflexi bacterium]|nr:DUF2007 domain-containing protein [Chloroflexota bacterium]
MPKAPDDRLVKLATARDEVEAGVWRDALEQEGIAVNVRNVDPLASFGASLPFSIELLVLAKDLKRARWVLGELERASS